VHALELPTSRPRAFRDRWRWLSRRAALALALVACAAPPSNVPSPPAQPGAPSAVDARTVAVSDVLGGQEIADPYRWMEGDDSPEFDAWLGRLQLPARGVRRSSVRGVAGGRRARLRSEGAVMVF